MRPLVASLNAVKQRVSLSKRGPPVTDTQRGPGMTNWALKFHSLAVVNILILAR